jgi:hypothetical protein
MVNLKQQNAPTSERATSEAVTNEELVNANKGVKFNPSICRIRDLKSIIAGLIKGIKESSDLI